jgi:hypothetical protein
MPTRICHVLWRLQKHWALVLALMALAGALMVVGGDEQAAAQATPLPIVIPTLTPTVLVQITITPSRTPTSGGPGQGRVEAKDKTTGANLRASPDISAEKLGTILPGQFYAIVGRSNKWIQIEYDKSPNGRAWVYEDIVNITGIDPAAIPTVGLDAIPSPNVATAAAKETANYLTATPGAPETATALQASATGVFTRVAADVTEGPQRVGTLPTFTFPPPLVEATLPPRASTTTNQAGVPPIVPIMVLAGVGLFGLLIAGLRRL